MLLVLAREAGFQEERIDAGGAPRTVVHQNKNAQALCLGAGYLKT